MPTVYSLAANQWPLLQSKTEQKFKSGIFNASAEFIRPVGNASLPTQIATSIGDLDVWPDPTVSSGTEGFERIHATCYGYWDSSITDATFNIEVSELVLRWSVILLCDIPEGCPGADEQILCGSPVGPNVHFEYKIPIFLETCYVRATGDGIPAIPGRTISGVEVSGLRLLDIAGLDISNRIFDIQIFSGLNPSGYVGTFQKSVELATSISSAKRNSYGSDITETEVVYELTASCDFGGFSNKVLCS